MRPTRRHHVNKRRSAKKFRKQLGQTKALNILPGQARGGIRM